MNGIMWTVYGTATHNGLTLDVDDYRDLQGDERWTATVSQGDEQLYHHTGFDTYSAAKQRAETLALRHVPEQELELAKR